VTLRRDQEENDKHVGFLKLYFLSEINISTMYYIYPGN